MNASSEDSSKEDKKTVGENSSSATELDQNSAPTRKKRNPLRMVAMVALPLALVLGGGIYYINGGREVSTEDSYISRDQVTVRAEISGKVVYIGAHENESIEKGQLLFEIDDSSYRIGVEQKKAALESARLSVEQLKSAYDRALAQKKIAEDTLQIAKAQKKRHDILADKGFVSQATLDSTNLTLQNDEGALLLAEQSVQSAKVALAGNPNILTDEHPSVMAALADLHEAELELEHTKVFAPSSGMATQTDLLQIGQYVTPSSAVLSLVNTEATWIEANYKETDLTHMKVGQDAEIEIDAYPSEIIRGEVESIGAGTGSAFALIPAQNASGNWVKVVQRIPVRIRLEPGSQVPELRLGMSAMVTVDTGHRRGLPKSLVSALDAIGLTTAQAQESSPLASFKASNAQ